MRRIDFGARGYNASIGRFDRVDGNSSLRDWLTPYNFCQNNGILRIDPDGNFDFVQKEDGNIYWDNNANSQETTKQGETYLGKTLTFNFTSYIDGKRWDGPTMLGLVDPAGVKLTSTVTLTGRENSKGELTSIVGTASTRPGDTPIGAPRDYYPGEGGSNNRFDMKSTASGININFEKHVSVSSIEEVGLNAMGYKIVDVAQKLDINYNSSNGNLSVDAYTNIFPSANLTVNDTKIMQYNQPSFLATHIAPVVGTMPTPRGVQPLKNFYYYPSKFYKRN